MREVQFSFALLQTELAIYKVFITAFAVSVQIYLKNISQISHD